MRYLYSLAFAGVVLLSIGGTTKAEDAAEDFFENTGVHALVDSVWDGFKETQSKNGFLAMLYAPWCGHCKSLKPEYIRAAEHLKFSAAKLVAVDCTKGGEKICKDYNVQGFPTLKWISDDGVIDYDSGRDFQAIVNFIERKTGGAEDHSETDFQKMRVKQLKIFLKARGVACEGCTEKHEFVAEAEKHRDTPKKTAQAKKKFSGKSSLVNGRTFAQERRYKEAKKVAEEGWEEGKGVVDHMVDDEFKAYHETSPKIFAMFYAPWCGHCSSFKPEFAKAAEHFKEGGEVKFMAMDCVTNPETCQKYGVTGYPTLKYIEGASNAVYGGGRTGDDVVKWVEKKLRGDETVGPFENEPLWDDNGDVVHMTDAHWAEYRKEHPRMFVMFYAPWCGHCKAMKGDFARASERLSSNIPLVAVDCTAQSEVCAKFKVEGYPSVKYFESSSSLKPEEYSGGRKEDDMFNFVKGKLEAKGVWNTPSDEVKPGKYGSKEEL